MENCIANQYTTREPLMKAYENNGIFIHSQYNYESAFISISNAQFFCPLRLHISPTHLFIGIRIRPIVRTQCSNNRKFNGQNIINCRWDLCVHFNKITVHFIKSNVALITHNLKVKIAYEIVRLPAERSPMSLYLHSEPFVVGFFRLFPSKGW